MSLLLNTKLRRKLLAYSFTHPNENFYVRELSNLIDVNPGVLWRELKRLEAKGLYVSSKKGRLKFISLNKNHPQYESLANIIFKLSGIEGGTGKPRDAKSKNRAKK